jgi:hypothetical protein
MNRRFLEPPSDPGRSRRSGSEVRSWHLNLNDLDGERVRFHFDRLAELGPLLDEPHALQLNGKLREHRFFLAGRPTRVSYWITSGRRIILLTVFETSQRKERQEIRRALRAMERCAREEHSADDTEEV